MIISFFGCLESECRNQEQHLRNFESENFSVLAIMLDEKLLKNIPVSFYKNFFEVFT
jgi:hypothetical protein